MPFDISRAGDELARRFPLTGSIAGIATKVSRPHRTDFDVKDISAVTTSSDEKPVEGCEHRPKGQAAICLRLSFMAERQTLPILVQARIVSLGTIYRNQGRNSRSGRDVRVQSSAGNRPTAGIGARSCRSEVGERTANLGTYTSLANVRLVGGNRLST